MVAFYGARFADAWRGTNADVVKAVWADELRDLLPEEWRRGVASLRTRAFPPTLPEFLALCRPPIDPEAAHAEAVREMRKRIDSGTDEWTRPEIFWAAQTLGWFDLVNHPYQRIQGRWKAALEGARREPVPVKLVELPRRGDVRADPEHVKRIMAQLDAKMRRAPRRDPDIGTTSDELAAAQADVERREAERKADLKRRAAPPEATA